MTTTLVVLAILSFFGYCIGLVLYVRGYTTMMNLLNRMESATHVVAENLADSVSRADATEGAEGAAADAALRTGDTAAKIRARQNLT